jgi:flagellin
MTVINSNSAAMLTANSINKNERMMTSTMERLSTGKRINSAADDPAGLAIATRLTSQVNGLNQAARNANNAISMVQIADNAADTLDNIFQRMREIVVQAADGSNSASDIALLNTEFTALAEETDRLVDTTSYNGRNIIDGNADESGGSSVTYQVGSNAGIEQTLTIDFGDLNLGNGGLGGDFSSWKTTGLGSNLNTTLTDIDTAISAVATQRATYGASLNRLEYAVDNLHSASLTTSIARGRIEDTNYAAETARLAKQQILEQVGTALLAQANVEAKSVLKLLDAN